VIRQVPAAGETAEDVNGYARVITQARPLNGLHITSDTPIIREGSASVIIYTTAVAYGGMPGVSSIKISETVKEVLSSIKVHPRETYSDVIERLVIHTRDGNLPGHIPLQYVKIKGTIRELCNPIDLSFEVENEEYIIYNNEYHLLVVAPDLHKGLKEINVQFEENWNDYIDQNEGELTPGALHFRNTLLSLFTEAI
jgi:hypothetical protein